MGGLSDRCLDEPLWIHLNNLELFPCVTLSAFSKLSLKVLFLFVFLRICFYAVRM